MNIILASGSPRRAKLLRQINLSFKVDASELEENANGITNPKNLVEFLAKMKGCDVAARYSNSMIIAADTIVSLNGKILGKPFDQDDAYKILRLLSGKTHQVFTGVYIGIIDSEGNISKEITFNERTNVTFSALTDYEIKHYINTGSPMDKAGAYGIQDDLGSLFVKQVEGDFYNVVGFPIHKFYQQLKTKLPKIHKTLFFR